MAATTGAGCSKAPLALPLDRFQTFPSERGGHLTMGLTIARLALLAAVGFSLASCQSSSKTTPVPTGKSASLLAMEQVAIAAHKCWIASKDPAFKAYQMANELNSYSGTPRFLLVPAKHYGGKPLLVVQAQGNSGKVDVFGPLMAEPVGARIGSDIARWQAGNPSCAAAA